MGAEKAGERTPLHSLVASSGLSPAPHSCPGLCPPPALLHAGGQRAWPLPEREEHERGCWFRVKYALCFRKKVPGILREDVYAEFNNINSEYPSFVILTLWANFINSIILDSLRAVLNTRLS